MSDSLQTVLSTFVVTLIEGLLGVLSIFLIAIARKGLTWISEKINFVKDERVRNSFNAAMDDLYNIVETTVTSIQQTLGDEIRKSISENDGKYTREDLLSLRDKAYETIMCQLSVASKEALMTVYTDLESLVIDMIETKVRELKLEGYPIQGQLGEVIISE